MNEPDEAYDRLVAADPAADAETRTDVLRAKADRVADAPGDELAERRTRRRTSWWVAAGVAGAVVLGGGGFALGAHSAEDGGNVARSVDGSAGTDGSASEAQAPIELGELGQGDPGSRGSTGAQGGDAAMTDAADSTFPGWYEGRSVFTANGLSSEAGSAAAYAYDAREVASKEGAARLAEALGVPGEPRWERGSWVVGPNDGSGANIWLGADATAYFSYSDPAVDPWQCDDAGVEEQERAADDADIAPAPACTAPAPEISPRQAVAQMRDVMAQVGVDPDGFEFEVPDDGEAGALWVSAEQVVDGQQTGSTWSATVGDHGVASIDGFLAQTAPLGEYPVVSPAEAVERLGDPRYGGSSWPATFPADVEGMLAEEWSEADGSEPTAPPAPPSSGSDLPWPVSEVTITEARLGLTRHTDADGAMLLLPAYELSDATGITWSVLAVADDALDTTSR